MDIGGDRRNDSYHPKRPGQIARHEQEEQLPVARVHEAEVFLDGVLAHARGERAKDDAKEKDIHGDHHVLQIERQPGEQSEESGSKQ